MTQARALPNNALHARDISADAAASIINSLRKLLEDRIISHEEYLIRISHAIDAAHVIEENMKDLGAKTTLLPPMEPR